MTDHTPYAYYTDEEIVRYARRDDDPLVSTPLERELRQRLEAALDAGATDAEFEEALGDQDRAAVLALLRLIDDSPLTAADVSSVLDILDRHRIESPADLRHALTHGDDT